MDTQRRQVREGRLEREGAGVLQQGEPRQARPQTSRTKSKDEGRRWAEEELLRSDAGNEEQTYVLKDGERPKFPD